MALPDPGDCLPEASAVFVLRGAIGPVDRGRAQGQVFGGAPRHPLAPQAKRARLELAAHERDDGALVEPELQSDGLKRCAVFPSHFDDAGDVFVREGNRPRWRALGASGDGVEGWMDGVHEGMARGMKEA